MIAIKGSKSAYGETLTMVLTRPLLVDLNFALLVLLLVVIGYKLSPTLMPVTTTTVVADHGCNLHTGPCSANLPDGRTLKIEISPHPLPVVRPMQLRVELDGPAPQAIDADLAGIGMAMGLNRIRLRPDSDGAYIGETSLTVCLTGVMRWQLTLLISTGPAVIGIPFHFTIPGR